MTFSVMPALQEAKLQEATDQLAQLQATRSADSRSNEPGHGNAGPPPQGVGTAEPYAYANGRRWTEAEVLQLETEVVALRRSILEQPPTPPLTETARIDQMLTSYLGPRDPHFAHPENPQMGEEYDRQEPLDKVFHMAEHFTDGSDEEFSVEVESPGTTVIPTSMLYNKPR